MPKSLHKDYYQAIIQIRPKDKDIIKFIKKQVDKRERVFISKEIEKKFGVDLYISDQKFARAIGKKLKDNFKGELKITKTLFSKDRLTSKLIYRSTVCFRVKKEQSL